MLYEFMANRQGNEDYKDKLKNLKKEKDLNGTEIQHIIVKCLEANYNTKLERSYGGKNESIFDVIYSPKEKYSYGYIELGGIEVKGDTDTYARLPKQILRYCFIFDGVYLAVHKMEPPKWLPEDVGIIRVFEDGTMYVEGIANKFHNLFEINSQSEWEALLKSNGIHTNHKEIQKQFDLVKDIRKNWLYNRFFAKGLNYETAQYEDFEPLTDEAKKLILGLNIPREYDVLKKDLTKLEKRFKTMRELVEAAKK